MNEVGFIISDEGLGGIVPFGRALRAAGVSPILLTGGAADSKLSAWRQVYDEVRVLENPYSAEALAGEALAAARGLPIAALFSCYDGLIIPAAEAAARLALPHPSIPGLKRSRNKYATRLTTSRHGLPTPRFFLITSALDCDRAGRETGFPAVIKPLNGMASHLVRRVNNPEELHAAYGELSARVDQSFTGNYARPLDTEEGERMYTLNPRTDFLVEEFLSGAEYSAEVLVRAGRFERVALFHKFIVDQNGFLERGFTRPALGESPERETLIWQHIEACLTALGVDDTAAHVEVIDTLAAAGPLLVEANTGRAGGQIIVRAVREATGVDLIAEIIALQCGRPRPPETATCLNGRVTTLTIFPPGSGRLERLEGLEEVARLPGVVEVIPFCGPGDVLDMRDKEFFAVNLLVAGVEGEHIFSLYQRACQLVRFVMTPLEG